LSKIAVIIDDWFEDSEYFKPVGAFSVAGHKIINVGLRKGKIVESKKEGKKVDIDKSVDEVSVDDFDALLIPGGYSPDRLRAHESPVDFVREFVKSGKPVFSICHAPQLLITAKVLERKKITGWKSIIQDIKNAGGLYRDEEVVIDDNIVSSRSPKDLNAFIKKSLEKMKQTT